MYFRPSCVKSAVPADDDEPTEQGSGHSRKRASDTPVVRGPQVFDFDIAEVGEHRAHLARRKCLCPVALHVMRHHIGERPEWFSSKKSVASPQAKSDP
jgi:hypothetical protein